MGIKTVVFDYGFGNVRSACRALEAVGASVSLTNDFHVSTTADRLVIPGVGAFGACIRAFQAVRGADVVQERLDNGLAVLGICVGHQILFDSSTETFDTSQEIQGLGQIPGQVKQLDAQVIPHMGWNTVQHQSNLRLFEGIPVDQRFYFVHSYAATLSEATYSTTEESSEVLMGTTQHENCQFISTVEVGNLFGTQFHPEKSGQAGLQLLRNFLNLNS
jgi:glutamine amidotransferase